MREAKPGQPIISRRALLSAGGAGLAAAWAPAFACAGGDLRPRDAIAAELVPLIDSGRLAGAVWEVRRHGRKISAGAAGLADMARAVPMREDMIFQIMSTSKVVIAVAIEMLRSRGKVDLDAPVGDYLPEFRDQWLLRDSASQTRLLVRPARASRVGDLLAHSSGLPDAPPNVGRFAVKLRYSLAELAGIMSQQPLEYEPGARYDYSNVGIAVAARIVEVVSGMPYERFVRDNILSPLGLERMGFRIAPGDERRVPGAYRFASGLHPLTDKGPGDGDFRFRRGARYVLPEAGLYATAAELATLFQGFLDDLLDGKAHLLPRQNWHEMLRPRLPITDRDAVVRTRQGLGWRIAAVDGGSTEGAMGRAGSFGHSGALGSTAWIDAKAGLVAVLMIQTIPGAEARAAFARGIMKLTG